MYMHLGWRTVEQIKQDVWCANINFRVCIHTTLGRMWIVLVKMSVHTQTNAHYLYIYIYIEYIIRTKNRIN